ncbi:hypothetical protein FOCC_FOCC003032 [Frankliniella occidentalis]|nr:hypothetical protein FOCC_FOCC003032 [Frankliniella occidentalis]
MDFELDLSLKEWAKDKPLSILQLDPADRAVLRIAVYSTCSKSTASELHLFRMNCECTPLAPNALQVNSTCPECTASELHMPRMHCKCTRLAPNVLQDNLLADDDANHPHFGCARKEMK